VCHRQVQIHKMKAKILEQRGSSFLTCSLPFFSASVALFNTAHCCQVLSA
jgi:hypothetical protein